MPTIAIIYHSGFGHTKAIAEHIAKGAAAAGASVTVLSVDDLPPPDNQRQPTGPWATLHSATALVFGTPTYMGGPSARFKQFMEATGTIWGQQGWKDKLAAGFTVSGSPCGDNLNVLTDLAIFAAQHSMIWVSLGTFYKNGPAESPDTINRLGSWLGLAAQADDASPEVTPPVSDRATAEAFGARIAKLAARW